VAKELWRLGFTVICPHMNTALLDGACDDSAWLEGDLEILKRCDAVCTVPGYQSSEGSRAELKEAIRRNIAIFNSPKVVRDTFHHAGVENYLSNIDRS